MISPRIRNIHGCRRYIRSLRLEPYASAYELCDQMSSLRGRPIRVIEWRLPVPGPLGVWISRERDDVIVVQELATGGHRDHIVLHELGHILCDHEGETLPGYAPTLAHADQMVPGGTVRGLRSVYDSAAEREAELFATAFAEQMTDEHFDPQTAWDVHQYFDGG